MKPVSVFPVLQEFSSETTFAFDVIHSFWKKFYSMRSDFFYPGLSFMYLGFEIAPNSNLFVLHSHIFEYCPFFLHAAPLQQLHDFAQQVTPDS